jgi:hypothetical protein
VIETSEGEADPQAIMEGVGLNPSKKREVYKEIKERLNNAKHW